MNTLAISGRPGCTPVTTVLTDYLNDLLDGDSDSNVYSTGRDHRR